MRKFLLYSVFVLFFHVFSCASRSSVNPPQLSIKEIFFDKDGKLVIVASNFSKISVCIKKECENREISSIFTETKMTFRGEGQMSIVFYDLSGKKKILNIDFDKRRISE